MSDEKRRQTVNEILRLFLALALGGAAGIFLAQRLMDRTEAKIVEVDGHAIHGLAQCTEELRKDQATMLDQISELNQTKDRLAECQQSLKIREDFDYIAKIAMDSTVREVEDAMNKCGVHKKLERPLYLPP